MDRTFDKWTAPFDKWTTLLTNGPTFWQMTHVFFFPFLRVNFSRENKFRLRMFVRCGVFFWDRGCLLGVGVFFFFTVDRGCLLGVGFFEITNVWQVWSIFLRSRMFDRCGVFFWDHECLTGVGVFLRSRMFDRCGFFFFLRSWMFVRCGVFFFFWEMWRESLIFERDDSWMWFGASHQKGSKVRSRIFLVHRLDRVRTTELELKIVCS